MTDHIELPDDPRDCHRAICDAFRVPCFDEWPLSSMPMAALHMAELYQRVQRSEADEAGWALDSLGAILTIGQDVLRQQDEVLRRVRALARHGTADHRELDADMAARRAAMEADA